MFLFLFLDALLATQIDIVGLAAILEAVDTAAESTPLALAVVQEDFIVKVLDEVIHCWSLFCVSILF